MRGLPEIESLLAAHGFRLDGHDRAIAALREQVLQQVGRGGRRREEALAEARKLGLDAGVLDDSRATRDRSFLSKALRGRGWTCSEVAQVLGCSERTVLRGFSR